MLLILGILSTDSLQVQARRRRDCTFFPAVLKKRFLVKSVEHKKQTLIPNPSLEFTNIQPKIRKWNVKVASNYFYKHWSLKVIAASETKPGGQLSSTAM